MIRKTAVELSLLALLGAATAAAGTREVRLQLLLEPELEIEGSERVFIGPVLIEPRTDEPVSTLDLTASREFDTYLRSLLRRETGLRVLDADEDLSPPTDNSVELMKMADFWSEVGRTTGADYVIAAAIDVKVLDRAGYTTEEYVSPVDGKTYFRQVLVEETGFNFDVLLMVFDGTTGELVFDEQISDFKERDERKLEAYVDMFDNLFNLQNRLLGVFVPRSVLGKRTLYTDVE